MKLNRLICGLFVALLIVLVGCADSGAVEQVASKDDEKSAPVVGDDWGDEIEPVVTDEVVPDEPITPLDPIDLRLTISSGQEQNYQLTNEITTLIQSSFNSSETEEYTSHLNARQSIVVDETETVFIQTTGVQGSVVGEGMMTALADNYMKATVKAIEGSMMVAAYDEKGTGINVKMIGDGIGLNPLGAQSGSQDATVGFMGVILPGGVVKPGDSWQGEYDAGKMADQVFAGQGAQTKTGTIPLTYFLRGYDVERGLAQISITGSGRPIVDIPLGNTIAKIEMHVLIEGEALVRLSDGWLHELRIETNVITEGYAASNQKVRTLVKLIK